MLDGTAVVIMLLHKTHGDNSTRQRQREGTKDIDADLQVKPSRGPGIRVNEKVSLQQLGLMDQCPLLRIRFRWQDRPGAFLYVLNSVSSALDKDPHAIRLDARSVSYARLHVATGRVAEGDLTIRIHRPPQEKKDWNRAIREQMARKIGV